MTNNTVCNITYHGALTPIHAKQRLAMNIIIKNKIEHVFMLIPTLSLSNLTDIAKANVEKTVTAVPIANNTQFSSSRPM